MADDGLKTDENNSGNGSQGSDNDAGKGNEGKDSQGAQGNNGASQSKVEFNPEQQKRVQELIDEAFKKAYTKAQSQKDKGKSDEVEQLKGEVEKLKDERRTAAVLKALSRHNVVDAEEVTELIKSHIRTDATGALTVQDSDGAPRINKQGEPMSVDEFVEQWLSTRPHHLRAQSNSGSGAASSRYGNGDGKGKKYDLADPAVYRNMPREELDRLLKEGIKVTGNGGQIYSFQDVKNPFLEARRLRAAKHKEAAKG